MAKPNKDNSSAGFLDRFLEVLYSFFRRFNKLFDRVVFNKAGSLIISLIASLVICIAIDYQDIRIELFNDTTTVVDLGNVNTEINLDQNKYEVSGIPSSVQVTLSGEETDIEAVSYTHLDVYKRQIMIHLPILVLKSWVMMFWIHDWMDRICIRKYIR